VIPASFQSITLTYAPLLLLLQGFEAIKGVLLEPEHFSVDNDCLTPTFKFKRPQLQKRYQVRPAVAAVLVKRCFATMVMPQTLPMLSHAPVVKCTQTSSQHCMYARSALTERC
jgi:hypothetical protein